MLQKTTPVFRRLPALLSAVLFLVQSASAQTWKIVEGRIQSPWAKEVTATAPLPEYPRPQLVRGNWQNLNGLWNYSISPVAETAIPSQAQGSILVPYPVEAALSGVGKTVGAEQLLWYTTTVDLAKKIRSSPQVILHFGAVDWRATIYINGKEAGNHQGGYDAFSINITPYLKKGTKQDIAVRVWDPSDDGPQPRGKQVKKPGSIWYTPVTGIWQTVWVEGVAAGFIQSTRHTPDIDKNCIKVETTVAGSLPGDELLISAWKGSDKIGEAKIVPGGIAELPVTAPRLWSPDDPFLYDLKIQLLRKGKLLDEVSSYFAMRKISMQKDKQGLLRMQLNNKFLFQYGPLDQGWWPEGLYTAPTDEALRFDVEQTKLMGFNMIRKHVKVEPARWYYHCDKLGMLVWQDMPSGDMGHNHWDMRPGQISGRQLESNRSAESESIYRTEWKNIMDNLYNFPSIVVWVPFNEAWGQFKTAEITNWTMQHDPSRLVNSASGGNFYPVGHILDVHHYPDPEMPAPTVFGGKQVLVLGEFGGLGLPVDGHTWQTKDNWGYQSYKNKAELATRYKQLIADLAKLIPMGLSAAVYTQTTDVEVEINGLMTYDRKEIKIPAQELKQVHQPLYKNGPY